MTLAVVTSTTNPRRAESCILSWNDVPTIILVNGRPWTADDATTLGVSATWITEPHYLGTVPAFRRAVDFVLREMPEIEIIACLHDDLEIYDHEWSTRVIRHFERFPQCGLLGFGGAIGLGDTDLYQKPYQPVQLARIGFRSNLVDAEVHGMRSLLPERVACLDGFSQIGRRAFWAGARWDASIPRHMRQEDDKRPWTYLEDLGIVHHFYDGALGCVARRYGWETWYLPMRCKHYGGQTAVGDTGYQDWAKSQIEGGDHGFWQKAHDTAYEAFKDVLPLRA
jgi:hypothetical protein